MKKFTLILAAVIASACAVTASAEIVGNDVTAFGVPSVGSGNPGGSGANVSVIVDGYRPVDGVDGGGQSRDTFGGACDPFEESFILEFEGDLDFTAVEFTEGMHFVDGGYFSDGSIKVQVRQGETWVDVTPTNEVGYPVGTAQADFGPAFETYTFEFAPVTGNAIRVAGMAGGNGTIHFGSCGELTVYSTSDTSALTTWADRLAAAAAAAEAERMSAATVRAETLGFIEQISTPITAYPDMADNIGGGSKTLSTIMDGVVPVDNVPVPQFDTICNAGKWDPYHADFFGYEFPGTYTVEYVEFYEGGNFFDGGFFANGEVGVEALIGGEWVEVETTVSPEYPEADDQESHFPEYQCFTFTLKEPTACEGIRVIGSAGGQAYFISCSELIVKAVIDTPAAEEPVVEEVVEETVEEPVVEEPAAEEVVVETPAVEETVVETPVVTAPQTFDAAVIAAISAVVSLAGYAISKKR